MWHSVQCGRVCDTARCVTRQGVQRGRVCSVAGCAAACTRLRGRAPQAILPEASLGCETEVRLPVASSCLWQALARGSTPAEMEVYQFCTRNCIGLRLGGQSWEPSGAGTRTPCQAGTRAGDGQSSPASTNRAKTLKTSMEITSPGQGITVQHFSLRSEVDAFRPLFSSSPRGERTHTLKMSGFFFPGGALLMPSSGSLLRQAMTSGAHGAAAHGDVACP